MCPRTFIGNPRNPGSRPWGEVSGGVAECRSGTLAESDALALLSSPLLPTNHRDAPQPYSWHAVLSTLYPPHVSRIPAHTGAVSQHVAARRLPSSTADAWIDPGDHQDVAAIRR